MPAADVAITLELAAELVRDQHPDLADLPIAGFARGWDNEVLALGDRWLLRLPRRATAAVLLEHELAWLPVLAAHCTLPVPVPVRRGAPGRGYPYPWSVVARLPGSALGEALLAADEADRLGGFVRALHVAAPAGAPANPLRGTPLADRQARFDAAYAALGELLDPATRARVDQVWQRALATPAWPHAPVWIHGDLHPLNVLRDDRGLAGVIDFGDLAAGDPATDLVIAFMGCDGRGRAAFLAASGADAATVERARGWALALGGVFAASDDPSLGTLGMRAIVAAIS